MRARDDWARTARFRSRRGARALGAPLGPDLPPEVDGYLTKAAGLGEMTPGMHQALMPLIDAAAEGGLPALDDALNAALVITATAACAEAGPASLLCGYLASGVGSAVASFFAEVSVPASPAEGRDARVTALYGQLMKDCPDDRGAGGVIYARCSDQLLALANLWVDGVTFSCGDPFDLKTASFPLETCGWCAMHEWQPGRPELASGPAYLAWLRQTCPKAFGELTTPYEFSSLGKGIRADLWQFAFGPYAIEYVKGWKTLGEMEVRALADTYAVLARQRFQTSVRRVLLAANIDREKVFYESVDALAATLIGTWLPRCDGNPPCEDHVKGDAWMAAQQAMLAARGVGADAGAPYRVLKAAGFQLRGNTEEARGHKSVDAGEVSPATKRPLVHYVKPVVAGVSLATAAGAGLAAYRLYKGLSWLPKSWNPARWLA